MDTQGNKAEPEIQGNKTEPETQAGSTALDKLLSADQSAILRLIESLRPISKYDIDLPRIIVCGDQSCGKSSVLEAISRLNFPRNEKLCTTFATELILDRQGASGVSVKIRWDNPKQGITEIHPKDDSAENSAENSVENSVENLETTINKAKEIIESHKQNGCNFFKDVLQIKASNPSWPPLTLVDLPGLIHSGNEANDAPTVKEMVRTYMSKEKTIILVVLQATNDHEGQIALDLAHDFDPEGRRTMAIITKPDRVPGPATEEQWISMAKNMSPRYKYELGWQVVRNRGVGEENSSFAERDRKEEEFFRNSAWMRELESDQLGIDNLRSKLSKILEDKIRNALPGIIVGLESKLKKCEQSLVGLGPSRITLDDQQKYLTGIGANFQEITRDAIMAQYGNEFFKEPRRRLIANVRSQNDNFVNWMYAWGHTYEESEHPISRDREALIVGSTSEPLKSPDVISRAEFIDMIQTIQKDYRGHELPGMCNPTHLTLLFRRQSSRWREIAKAHLDIVWTTTREFLRDAAVYATGPDNPHTTAALVNHIISPDMKNKKQTMLTKLDEILQPYESFPVMTHDPEFLRKQRELYAKISPNNQNTLINHLAGGQPTDVVVLGERLANYRLESTEFPSDSSQLLDLMKLYYQNAIRTFIDNVISLTIDKCLVNELSKLFTPAKVQDIARENKSLLEALASEPADARKRRTNLEDEQEVLSKALDDCTNQLGDINMYTIDDTTSLDLNSAQPSVNVLPPESSSADPPFPYHRSTPNTPSKQSHSRASSVHSSISNSTPLTEQSPESSVSDRDGEKRRHRRILKVYNGAGRLGGNHLAAEEEL